MGKFEKGLITLVLLLVGGIGLMYFPMGKRDESSSEVLDTSEYQKALKVTHPKNRELHVELTAKTADKTLKVRGDVLKSGATTQLKQLLQKENDKDIDFKLSGKKGTLDRKSVV